MVTEACANVVEHAYEDGEPGSIEISVTLADDFLTVIVRDRGIGFGARPAERSTSMHMGLVLIGRLTSSYEVATIPEGGTELTMRLARGTPA